MKKRRIVYSSLYYFLVPAVFFGALCLLAALLGVTKARDDLGAVVRFFRRAGHRRRDDALQSAPVLYRPVRGVGDPALSLSGYDPERTQIGRRRKIRLSPCQPQADGRRRDGGSVFGGSVSLRRAVFLFGQTQARAKRRLSDHRKTFPKATGRPLFFGVTAPSPLPPARDRKTLQKQRQEIKE